MDLQSHEEDATTTDSNEFASEEYENSTEVEIIEEIDNDVQDNDGILTGLRCAAHTLQLSIGDTLQKDRNTSKLIAKVREIAKKLRTPNIFQFLKKQNLNKPKLDVATRWSSTVEMIESVLQTKDFCTELRDTNFCDIPSLTDKEWDQLEGIFAALEPFRICTKRLQSEQMILSDFYAIWCETKTRTTKIEFIDSENEVEIHNLELPPTQDSDLEIIENSDLELVQVSEAEDSVDRLLQSVFQQAASSTQNRDPGLESLE
ncbi:zinc finger BED domain-containing protein 4-like [Drosophila biarmipes]|uniref:zinc finger BED domain-containing protein 4-like n=1 Tax=Drosophila biarmipes TaxID=125945 RepID=UPI0021CCD0C5|nr:zinc finger BED domain-containing protein 4-like [Drosophila biarmipes]